MTMHFMFTKVTSFSPCVKISSYASYYCINVVTRTMFPSHSFLVKQVFLTMVTKTMDSHVLPNLEFAIAISISFDLWMSEGGVNTFVLVINYLDEV